MNAFTIGIIDYGSGNLRSVSKALDVAGARTRFVSTPDAIDQIGAVVVPGVGAFGDCARNLRATGLWDPLREWIAADRPYLGICLGYQLLFESSEESPGVPGLGALPGVVRRFPSGPLKVPHMGWNPLHIVQPADRLYRGLPAAPSVYFVHSYFPVPADSSLVTATCDYAGSFAASITRGALSAVQFHPEKSQAVGLAILRNFVASIDALAASH
ncbi:MAG: imidazole glycerol phosphate synthase subunit HisH [Terrimicrobiaceae bacterium]|nr:imidazole glycerol phosphate synthase subunit HisH [Terrimicrobiaceae bacterium]